MAGSVRPAGSYKDYTVSKVLFMVRGTHDQPFMVDCQASWEGGIRGLKLEARLGCRH
jgi:hypothetical protein